VTGRCNTDCARPKSWVTRAPSHSSWAGSVSPANPDGPHPSTSEAALDPGRIRIRRRLCNRNAAHPWTVLPTRRRRCRVPDLPAGSKQQDAPPSGPAALRLPTAEPLPATALISTSGSLPVAARPTAAAVFAAAVRTAGSVQSTTRSGRSSRRLRHRFLPWTQPTWRTARFTHCKTANLIEPKWFRSC